MEILFVIGNGFDMNLGMKTAYSDFYNYYMTTESNHELVKMLKAEMADDLKSWADLELALGEFTKNITTIDEFDIVFDDIGDHLADYLKEQEDKLDIALYNRDKFLEYLGFPERSLPQADIDSLRGFKRAWKNSQWNVNIITLNYTLSIERFFDKPILTDTTIGTHKPSNLPITLNSIQHIHGFTDNRMIMGVNDASQIKNEALHNNTEVLEAIIKSNCNKVQKHTVDEICANKIQSANLICIFGSSIGDTDNNWWELIGKQLKRDARIIIYTRGEEVKRRTGYKIARVERAIRDRFLSKTKLNEKERQTFAPNIYVAVNTDMFQLMEAF